jgi:hypothetical protein
MNDPVNRIDPTGNFSFNFSFSFSGASFSRNTSYGSEQGFDSGFRVETRYSYGGGGVSSGRHLPAAYREDRAPAPQTPGTSAEAFTFSLTASTQADRAESQSPTTNLDNSDRAVPPLFNEERVARIERTILALEVQRDVRLGELDCLTTRGVACLETPPNAGYEALGRLNDTIRGGPEPSDPRLRAIDPFVMERVIQRRINIVRQEIGIIQERIDSLTKIRDHQKAIRGRRFYP